MWLDEDPSRSPANPNPGLTGNALPILKEILTLLERLDATGEGGGIDLTSLPMSAADRQWLRDALGEGAVKININAGGPSVIEETATSGVWWIIHFNEHNAQVGEFIEVTLIPDIVPTQLDDVASGVKRLEARLTA
ncbi:MAG: hydrogenase expression/formation C-terminal domain-containing protein [Thiobacillaceae bacterium]